MKPYNDVDLSKERLKNAMCETIGHELTHKSGDLKHLYLFCRSKADIKFINHIREVRADFGGAYRLTTGDKKQNLIDALEYKLDYLSWLREPNNPLTKTMAPNKIKELYSDTEGMSHPSLIKRVEYAKYGIFDATLIKQIANDAGCTNKKLIDIAISHYSPIYLN